MARGLFVLSLAIALITAAVWDANPHTSAGQPLFGDASCDGTVNSIDAAVVLQYSAGLLPSLGCPDNADVNADGHTNSLDSALILQFAAGLITHLGPPGGATPTNTAAPGATNTPVSTATNTHVPTVTNTPPPNSTPVQHEPIYYYPTFYWSNTEIALHAGQRIDLQATGSVIYDNYHLTGVSADGDGELTGWGNCQDHSLVGWVGDVRPAADAPVSLSNVICLGADFSGTVPTGGSLYISINDRSAFSNNVGSWNVTVTTY